MRNAYTRFVLWLIRPALELHESRKAAMAKRLGQALGEPKLTAEQLGKKAGEAMRRAVEGPLS